jgi:LPS export ABC transporter protein LptC
MSSPINTFPNVGPNADPSADRARRLSRAQTRATLLQKIGFASGLAVIGLVTYFIVKAGFLVPPSPQNVKNDVVVASPETATGQEARISGFDRNNHAYEIRAKSGVQDKTVSSLVHLDKMTADFIRPAGDNLAVTSDKAHFDNRSKIMDLAGNVVLDQGQKFKATMDKATVNTVDQTLQSQSPVVVETRGGVIHADSLTVTENGNRVLFKGGVRAHFEGSNNR